jgi:hypothetical protein
MKNAIINSTGNGTKSDLELVKGNFKILSVSRNGKCKIKIFASKGIDELIKVIANDTFKIVIITKKSEPVEYIIDSKDLKYSTVTLQLNFQDPSQISNTTELDRVEARVINEP